MGAGREDGRGPPNKIAPMEGAGSGGGCLHTPRGVSLKVPPVKSARSFKGLSWSKSSPYILKSMRMFACLYGAVFMEPVSSGFGGTGPGV